MKKSSGHWRDPQPRDFAPSKHRPIPSAATIERTIRAEASKDDFVSTEDKEGPRRHGFNLASMIVAMAVTGLVVYSVALYRVEHRIADTRVNELTRSLAEKSAAFEATQARANAEGARANTATEQIKTANQRAKTAEDELQKLKKALDDAYQSQQENLSGKKRTQQRKLSAEEQIQWLNTEITRLQ